MVVGSMWKIRLVYHQKKSTEILINVRVYKIIIRYPYLLYLRKKAFDFILIEHV